MFRKTLASIGVAAALTLIPTAAHALDCSNVSRPGYTGSDWIYVADIQSNVHFVGNWGYVEAWQRWVFLPPGTVPGMPDSNGNFENGQGFALTYNAHCDSKGAVLLNRQSDHGIQLMDGCLEAP
ncbi:hypothetical protein [Sinomonas flava]|uniref:Secreted protein n=1 Tax=Sinomonas flava TaxID=496857 RepID=A0ABN3BP18_9MICC